MSADSINHPLLVRENSDESTEDESPTEETRSQCDSGTSGPSICPDNVNEGQLKDGHHKIPQEENGKTGTSSESETRGENGLKNDRSKRQSDKNHEKDSQNGEQRETHKQGTSPPKNEPTEQVQGSSSFPKQETTSVKSYAQVTTIHISPPHYNLRPRQDAPERTMVKSLFLKYN